MTVPPSNIHIGLATEADVPALAQTYLTAYTHPLYDVFHQRGPELTAWWEDFFRRSVQDSSTRVLKAVDTSLDQESGGKMVAFARWALPDPEGKLETPWPELAPMFNKEIADAMIGGTKKSRAETMGKRPHWYLEVVGTIPSHQRMGIASEMIRWGSSQADAAGLEMYLDASPDGKPVYERNGFEKVRVTWEIQDDPRFGDYILTCMVRQSSHSR